jgi:hypothetical protein
MSVATKLKQEPSNVRQFTLQAKTRKLANAMTHADCFFAPLEIQHVLFESSSQPAL